MAQKRIKIDFPFGGVSDGLSRSTQAEGTTRDAANVRGREASTGRMRGAQRPGINNWVYDHTVNQPRDDDDNEWSVKVDSLASINYDRPRVNWVRLHDYINESIDEGLPQNAWQGNVWHKAQSGDGSAYSACIDNAGNIYCITKARQVHKYSPDGVLIHTIAVPGSTGDSLVRRVQVDLQGNIYVVVASGSNADGGQFMRFEEDEDVGYAMRWAVQLTSRPVDFRLEFNTVFMIVRKSTGLSYSAIQAWGGLNGDSPIKYWERYVPHPCNALDVGDGGQIYITCPANSDRLRAPEEEGMTAGAIGWTPNEIYRSAGRIYSWIDAYNLPEVADGGVVDLWADNRGFIPQRVPQFLPVYDTQDRSAINPFQTPTLDAGRFSPLYSAKGFGGKPCVRFDGKQVKDFSGTDRQVGNALYWKANKSRDNRLTVNLNTTTPDSDPWTEMTSLVPGGPFAVWTLFFVVRLSDTNQPQCLLHLYGDGPEALDLAILANVQPNAENTAGEISPGKIMLWGQGTGSSTESSISGGTSTGDKHWTSAGSVDDDAQTAVISIHYHGFVGQNDGEGTGHGDQDAGKSTLRINGVEVDTFSLNWQNYRITTAHDSQDPKLFTKGAILGAPFGAVNADAGQETRLQDFMGVDEVENPVGIFGFTGDVCEALCVTGFTKPGGSLSDQSYTGDYSANYAAGDLDPDANGDVDRSRINNTWDPTFVWGSQAISNDNYNMGGGVGGTARPHHYAASEGGGQAEASEEELIEAYLAHKWGIANTLDEAHPFHGVGMVPGDFDGSTHSYNPLASFDDWGVFLSANDKALINPQPIVAKFDANNGNVVWAVAVSGAGYGVISDKANGVYTVGSEVDPELGDVDGITNACARKIIDLGTNYSLEDEGELTAWTKTSTGYGGFGEPGIKQIDLKLDKEEKNLFIPLTRGAVMTSNGLAVEAESAEPERVIICQTSTGEQMATVPWHENLFIPNPDITNSDGLGADSYLLARDLSKWPVWQGEGFGDTDQADEVLAASDEVNSRLRLILNQHKNPQSGEQDVHELTEVGAPVNSLTYKYQDSSHRANNAFGHAGANSPLDSSNAFQAPWTATSVTGVANTQIGPNGRTTTSGDHYRAHTFTSTDGVGGHAQADSGGVGGIGTINRPVDYWITFQTHIRRTSHADDEVKLVLYMATASPWTNRETAELRVNTTTGTVTAWSHSATEGETLSQTDAEVKVIRWGEYWKIQARLQANTEQDFRVLYRIYPQGTASSQASKVVFGTMVNAGPNGYPAYPSSGASVAEGAPRFKNLLFPFDVSDVDGLVKSESPVNNVMNTNAHENSARIGRGPSQHMVDQVNHFHPYDANTGGWEWSTQLFGIERQCNDMRDPAWGFEAVRIRDDGQSTGNQARLLLRIPNERLLSYLGLRAPGTSADDLNGKRFNFSFWAKHDRSYTPSDTDWGTHGVYARVGQVPKDGAVGSANYHYDGDNAKLSELVNRVHFDLLPDVDNYPEGQAHLVVPHWAATHDSTCDFGMRRAARPDENGDYWWRCWITYEFEVGSSGWATGRNDDDLLVEINLTSMTNDRLNSIYVWGPHLEVVGDPGEHQGWYQQVNDAASDGPSMLDEQGYGSNGPQQVGNASLALDGRRKGIFLGPPNDLTYEGEANENQVYFPKTAFADSDPATIWMQWWVKEIPRQYDPNNQVYYGQDNLGGELSAKPDGGGLTMFGKLRACTLYQGSTTDVTNEVERAYMSLAPWEGGSDTVIFGHSQSSSCHLGALNKRADYDNGTAHGPDGVAVPDAEWPYPDMVRSRRVKRNGEWWYQLGCYLKDFLGHSPATDESGNYTRTDHLTNMVSVVLHPSNSLMQSSTGMVGSKAGTSVYTGRAENNHVVFDNWGFWGFQLFVNPDVPDHGFPTDVYYDPGVSGVTSIALPLDEPDYSKDAEIEAGEPGWDNPEGPEFMYFTVQKATGRYGPNIIKHRLVVAEPVIDEDQSARATRVLGIAGGSIWSISKTNGWERLPGGEKVIASGVHTVQHTTHFGKLYFTDGINYFVYDPIKHEITKPETTSGELPPRASLIASYRGRLVFARTAEDPGNYYMSKIGDPEDWNFYPAFPNASQALAGTTVRAGKSPDVINALIPYNDDLLLLGGDRSILRMTGDPASGGQIDTITSSVGIAFGKAWCMDPEGVLYFFSPRGQVYAMTPTGQPQQITTAHMDARMRSINLTANHVELHWSTLDRGLHVFVLPHDVSVNPENYFWEKDTNSWWPDIYHGARQPHAVTVIDGEKPDDRAILVGNQEGVVGYFDPLVTSDLGERIESFVTMSISEPQDAELTKFKLVAVHPVMGQDTLNAQLSVEARNDPTSEALDLGERVPTVDLGPGRNRSQRMRQAAQFLDIRIENAAPNTYNTAGNWEHEKGYWALEELRVDLAESGRRRFRDE